jgi:hypothetical protein
MMATTDGFPAREPCETDDGSPRDCCGTRQLGPHAEDCPRTAAFQEAMNGHEQMYSHVAEIRGGDG